MTINERIRLLYENSGERSIRRYAHKMGIPPTTLNECIKGAEPRVSLIKAILDGEPSISSEWLLRGTGEMFLQSGDGKSGDEEELKKEIFRLETENKLLREFAGLRTSSSDVESSKEKSE